MLRELRVSISNKTNKKCFINIAKQKLNLNPNAHNIGIKRWYRSHTLILTLPNLITIRRQKLNTSFLNEEWSTQDTDSVGNSNEFQALTFLRVKELSSQSAYRKGHSTETALVKVCSDFIGMIDSGEHALLALLDLSSAFDTVDHDILLTRLSRSFGVCGNVLSWMRSYLSGRT